MSTAGSVPVLAPLGNVSGVGGSPLLPPPPPLLMNTPSEVKVGSAAAGIAQGLQRKLSGRAGSGRAGVPRGANGQVQMGAVLQPKIFRLDA